MTDDDNVVDLYSSVRRFICSCGGEWFMIEIDDEGPYLVCQECEGMLRESPIGGDHGPH